MWCKFLTWDNLLWPPSPPGVISYDQNSYPGTRIVGQNPHIITIYTISDPHPPTIGAPYCQFVIASTLHWHMFTANSIVVIQGMGHSGSLSQGIIGYPVRQLVEIDSDPTIKQPVSKILQVAQYWTKSSVRSVIVH